MKKKRTYFKGLDDQLRGINDFQYQIGGVFTADTDDTWHWLFFTTHIETAIKYGPRIVEVEPVTRVISNGADDMCAKSIRVLRELTLTEVLARLTLRPHRKNEARLRLEQLDLLHLIE